MFCTIKWQKGPLATSWNITFKQVSHSAPISHSKTHTYLAPLRRICTLQANTLTLTPTPLCFQSLHSITVLLCKNLHSWVLTWWGHSMEDPAEFPLHTYCSLCPHTLQDRQTWWHLSDFQHLMSGTKSASLNYPHFKHLYKLKFGQIEAIITGSILTHKKQQWQKVSKTLWMP